MALTAKSLSAASIRSCDIREIHKELVHSVDDKLRAAPKKFGRNVLEVELPTMFSLPLAKADAQRLIYYSLMHDLEKRGFEVAINIEDERSVMYVAWHAEFSSLEVAAMNSYIKARRLNGVAVAGFYERGITPAPDTETAVAAGHAEAPRPLKSRRPKQSEMTPRDGVAAPAEDTGHAAEASILDAVI